MSILQKCVDKMWGPKVVMAKKEEDEFEKAFQQIAQRALDTKSQIAANILSSTPAPLRFVRSGPLNPGPHQGYVKCARLVLLKLIEQADSIIADPEDLAKRAWAIADAMEQQEKERCK